MKRTQTFDEAVLSKYALHEQAFRDRDAEPIVNSFFTDDADWAFQNFPPLKGRESLLAFFREAMCVSSVRIDPISAKSNETMGWSQCDYHVQPFDNGAAAWTYLTIYTWELVGDEWLVRVAMGDIVP